MSGNKVHSRLSAMSRSVIVAFLSNILFVHSFPSWSASFIPLKRLTKASGGSIRMSTEESVPSDINYDSLQTPSSSASQSTKSKLGEWEEMHGNYLLKPPPNAPEPRALIHFLGGAFVGAAPDLSYRYILEKLAERGFLIVATPYKLSFDYIETCDDIIGRFERIAPHLARQFGAVPVVGVGHSCGALLQLLITSLFPDTPRAANALLSYNNKPVKEAVPLFEEVFSPLFTSISGDRSANGTSALGALSSPTVAMNFALELGRVAVRGNLPSDQLLSDIAKFATPQSINSLTPDKVVVPTALRDTLKKTLEPLTKIQDEAGITPYIEKALDVLEQVPLLIDEVADGARDFNPPPSSVQAAARRGYRARRTLLIQYKDDGLDESELIEKYLDESKTVMRMKRPMVDFDIQRTVLDGFHATPCLAPPLDLANKAEDILGEETARDSLLYNNADATVNELIRWLEQGQL